MAGDWIKFEVSTSDKPEVFVIAKQFDIDPDAVVGKLLRVWGWFDQHTIDGHAPSVTKMLLDRVTGVTGLCDAMIRCGWLEEHDDLIIVANFDRHNGETAKKRALAARRQAKQRKESQNSHADSNAPSVTKSVTSALLREDKREDKEQKKGKPGKTPIPLPDWLPPGSWQDFKAARRELKAPLGPVAEQRAIAKLGRLVAEGQDPVAVIDQSIENGWRGLFAIKTGSTYGNGAESWQAKARRLKIEARDGETEWQYRDRVLAA